MNEGTRARLGREGLREGVNARACPIRRLQVIVASRRWVFRNKLLECNCGLSYCQYVVQCWGRREEGKTATTKPLHQSKRPEFMEWLNMHEAIHLRCRGWGIGRQVASTHLYLIRPRMRQIQGWCIILVIPLLSFYSARGGNSLSMATHFR